MYFIMEVLQDEAERTASNAWYLPLCDWIEAYQSASTFSILIEILYGEQLEPKDSLVKAHERLPKFL